MLFHVAPGNPADLQVHNLTIHLSTPLTHTNSRIRALAAQQEYAFRRLMPSRCQKRGRLA